MTCHNRWCKVGSIPFPGQPTIACYAKAWMDVNPGSAPQRRNITKTLNTFLASTPMMRDSEVLSWRESVVTRSRKHTILDELQESHPAYTKRARRGELPSPSPSAPGTTVDGCTSYRQMSTSALQQKQKRRLRDNPEPIVLESDIEADRTPRAKKSTSIFDLDDRSISLGDSTPSRASSKASKASRNSSPREQFRNAELQQTGFRTASFEDEIKSPSLKQLRRDLIGIQRGDRILPQGLRAQVCAAILF